MSSIWDILGIKPTRDKKQIKLAYTNKLKSTNPEDNQEKFQELRSAYETALAYAGRSQEKPRRNHVRYTLNIDPSQEKQFFQINRDNKSSDSYIKHMVDKIFHHASRVNEVAAIKAFEKIVRIGVLDDLKVHAKVTRLVLYKLCFLEEVPYELALALFKYLRWDINSLALSQQNFNKIAAILDTAEGLRYIDEIKRSKNSDKLTLNSKKAIEYLESPTGTILSNRKIRKITKFLSNLRFKYPGMKLVFANPDILYQCRQDIASLSLGPPVSKKKTGSSSMTVVVCIAIVFICILASVSYMASISTKSNNHQVSIRKTSVDHENDSFVKNMLAEQRMKDNYFNLGLDAQKNKRYKQAIKYYKKAASWNVYGAMLNLGNIYLEDMHDHQKAIYWYKKATQADDNISAMAFCALGIESYSKKDFNKAINYFKESYKRGYRNSYLYYYLGKMYIYGQGVKIDVGVGLYWLKKSADDNNSSALAFFANAYYKGNYVKRDFSKAFKYCQELAFKGYVPFEYNLGLLYYYGQGTPKDYLKAFKWYQKAAIAGDHNAQYELALMYYHGEAMPRSYHMAFRWARKSAIQGNPRAEELLGNLYREGLGTKKNDCLAFHWYRKSAIHGDPVGQNNLGSSYLFGVCVKPDRNMAYQWFKIAANNGSKVAKQILRKQFSKSNANAISYDRLNSSKSYNVPNYYMWHHYQKY